MENLPKRKAQNGDITLLPYYKLMPLSHKQWGMHLALSFWSLSVAQVISESTMDIFKRKKFYFGIILDLQRGCKEGSESSHTSFTQWSLKLTPYVTPRSICRNEEIHITMI